MIIKHKITLGKGNVQISFGTINNSDDKFLGFSYIDHPADLKSGDDFPEDVVVKKETFFAIVFKNKKSAEVLKMAVNDLLEEFKEKENA